LISQKTMTSLNWICMCFYVYTSKPVSLHLCILGFENMKVCSSRTYLAVF